MVEMNGGQIVDWSLTKLGCNTVFSVSGNQIMPIYDAAIDYGVRIFHMRHETAAAYAAASNAELSGQPGVVLTSAGPGFLATLQGVAAAATMELPLLFLSGDSPVSQDGHGAFQDLDQQRIAGAICKSSLRVKHASDIAESIQLAWQLAQQHVPGPVHISLPADVLLATTNQPDFEEPVAVANQQTLSSTDHHILDLMTDRLARSERPLIIARPTAARGLSGQLLETLARSLGVEPVIIEAPRGLSDLRYLNHVPHFPMSDCALVVGPADFAVDFLHQDSIALAGDLLLIDSEGDPEPQREPWLHIRSEPAIALSHIVNRLKRETPTDPEWSALWPVSEPPPADSTGADGLHPLAVTEIVRTFLQPDDILVLDGGEFCQWMRYGLRDLPNTMLWNGKIGAIGGGVPMAVGAAVNQPGRRVFTFIGDGTAGYHLSEFETAARYELPITTIIGNDARWAAEWHLQINRYGPERIFETSLREAHYEQAAIGFSGGNGEFVTSVDQIANALEELTINSPPLCLNVRIQAVQSPAKMA